MNKPTKSLVVPTIITCTFAWVWFISHAVESKNDGTNESINAANLIERIKENTITSKVDSFYTEFERLKEEERKRLEELERQRLERLEKIRLAKIEEAKKIAKQKRIEELKKQRQEKIVSRGDSNPTGSWMTFNASYYTAYCSEGCTGVTATGYDVSNTIYYNGLRIIATDPNVIKLGTVVEVKTPYETFKAISLDTGQAIKNHKVDILVSNTQEAINLGRHNIQIKILKTPQ